MLTVSRLSKSFGGQTLFEDASLQVNRGERIALIGPNGAGKTTLISILLELEEADCGEVAFQRGVKIGFLPQESAPVGDETVLEMSTSLSADPQSKDFGNVAPGRLVLRGFPAIRSQCQTNPQGLGFPGNGLFASGENHEWRMDHESASGAFAGHGTGFAPA